MKPVYLSLGLAMICGTACSRLNPEVSTRSDVAAISAVRSELDATIIARNAGRVAALFTHDAVYLQADEREIVGRPALTRFLVEAYGQPGPAPKGKRVAKQLQVVGDWAFEWGQVEAVRPATGGADTWKEGKYLHVYQRQSDGRWLIARASYTSHPPQSARLHGKLRSLNKAAQPTPGTVPPRAMASKSK